SGARAQTVSPSAVPRRPFARDNSKTERPPNEHVGKQPASTLRQRVMNDGSVLQQHAARGRGGPHVGPIAHYSPQGETSPDEEAPTEFAADRERLVARVLVAERQLEAMVFDV